jgi:formate dehydrogenase subunit gamma
MTGSSSLLPSAWAVPEATALIAELAGMEGALLPVLHALQHRFGFVPDAAVPLVAEALNLSRAEVHGVLTFYHDFRRAPAGRRVVKLCGAEACQARGSRALAADAEAQLGVPMGKTSADGRVTLETVYCLGLCASGPAAMIDDRPVARLDASSLGRLLEQVR